MGLVKRVNIVLTEQWDPIGVKGISPEHAYTEYSSYAMPVAGMIERGESVRDIAKYLYFIRTDTMGMTPALPFRIARKERRVAEQLLALKRMDQ